MTNELMHQTEDSIMRAPSLLALCACLLFALPARAEVRVYVPGGMAAAMEDIAAAAQQAGLEPPVLVIGHSPAQARQIANGAPADIFISADPRWMAVLASKHLLAEGTQAPLASAALVVIASRDGAFKYAAKPGESLAADLGDGKLAIPDPDTTPTGRRARAALQALGAWDGLNGKLAILEDVRTAVALVDRGEAAAGIVLSVDLARAKGIRVAAELPATAAPPLRFPIAILAGHRRPEVGRFYDFVRGAQAKAVLRAHGFSD